MKTGRALAKILKLEGVEFLSCFPHNPLVDPVAEGLGGYTEKVEHPAQLAGALERAKKIVEAGKPALLEIITKAEREMPLYWR